MAKDVRRERYDELVRMTEDNNLPYNDALETERVQLFYELNPDDFKAIGGHKGEKPRDVWGVDTSCYDR